jgi:aminoglycoside phosphotransferase family enzyme
LRDPGCYALHAGAGPAVEWIETHISLVALTGDLVFKLKKPVRLPFLDFSTRELRRAACREEVRLNRRLCPTTYLGIAPLLVKTIFERIVEINREQGLTVLLVEQNANLALDVSTYGYVLESGKILIEGPSKDLKANPEVQAAYLGC